MKSGRLGKSVRLTVPYVYIEPRICFKDGAVDKEVFKAVEDLWKNYNVNIRYLYVHPDTHQETNIEELALNYKMEQTTEGKLLSHISPEIVVCFFGRKEVLPSNHKVYSRDDLVNNYKLILSALCANNKTDNSQQRYHRRRY